LLIFQSNLLHQLDPEIYDFTAIQEPYLDRNHNSWANHHWFMVYPKEHYTNPSRTRSIMLVNRRLASDAWSQVDICSSDMTAIAVNTGIGRVLIINTYKDIELQNGLMSSIRALRKSQWAGESEDHAEQTIWVGDFNLHHPL